MEHNHPSDQHDHAKGTMDLTEHQKTWNFFMGLTKVGTLVIGALVAFLTIWIAGGWSFLAALAFVLLGCFFVWFLFR